MDDTLTLSKTEIETRSFINDVYHWMLYGLSLTGIVAWWISNQPALIQAVAQNRTAFFILLLIELGLVFALAGWVQKMSTTEAAVAYLAYAALNGITMSCIFLVYTKASIALAFFVTAATFAVMSVYGYVTKTDLTAVGNICFMGLVGIIIASIANWFLRSSTVYWVTTYVGVLVFVGLTAYDTQKIKQMAATGAHDPDAERKEAIFGALTLYLDFVNLFLDLLRIMGKRRD
jgi:uncharacterized protein